MQPTSIVSTTIGEKKKHLTSREESIHIDLKAIQNSLPFRMWTIARNTNENLSQKAKLLITVT